MKRKPKKSEILLLFLMIGIGLTLALDPELFVKQFSPSNGKQIHIIGGQTTTMWVSFGLGAAIFTSFYITKTNVMLSLIIASFSFLLILTTNAATTYPNLLTVFMVGILAAVLSDLFSIIDESEERKKQEILETYIDGDKKDEN